MSSSIITGGVSAPLPEAPTPAGEHISESLFPPADTPAKITTTRLTSVLADLERADKYLQRARLTMSAMHIGKTGTLAAAVKKGEASIQEALVGVWDADHVTSGVLDTIADL